MNCSLPRPEPSDSETRAMWIQVSALALLGVGVSVSNTCLLARLGNRKRRLRPFERLLKAQCVWGIVLLLNVIPLHTVILIAGPGSLNETRCSFGGTFFQIVLGTWTTLQTLVLLERYIKILKPSEHLMLFSKVNIKLILWSTVLMHGMISLGPTYGWGQYTHSNERLRFWLLPTMVANHNSSAPGLSLNDSELQPKSQPMTLNGTLVKQYITEEALAALFQRSGVSAVDFYVFPAAMQIDLVGGGDVNTSCIKEKYQDGTLSRILEDFFWNSDAFRGLCVSDNTCHMNVQLDKKLIVLLNDVITDKSYHDSSICEVNYQVITPDDSFYVIITSLVQLCTPLALMLYFGCRVAHCVWIIPHRLKITLTKREFDNNVESLIGASIFTILVIPYFACNFAIKNNHTISPTLHFLARFSFYLSTAGTTFSHMVTHKGDHFSRCNSEDSEGTITTEIGADTTIYGSDEDTPANCVDKLCDQNSPLSPSRTEQTPGVQTSTI